MSVEPFDIEVARRTVLVVDDDEAIREMVARVFEGTGLVVKRAEDAAEALEHLAQSPVGVAIIDKNLPGELGGLDIVEQLPRYSLYTKAIILTAHASTESAIDALRLGAFDYLRKPFRLKEIKDKVAEAFAELDRDYDRDEMLSRHGILFETVPGVVWFMTDRGVIKRINQTGAELLGYVPGDLVGRSYEVLLSDKSQAPEVHWAFKERQSGTRATRRLVVELKAADGSTRLFEIYSAGAYLPVLGQEGVTRFHGTVGVAHDITEHNLLQQQLQQAQKMEALGRFAGGIAHDFNNMLAVIINNVDFVAAQIPGSPGRVLEDLAEIKKAGGRAAALTRQLLTFSRKDVVHPRVVDLAEVVAETLGMVERLVGEDIEIELVRGESLAAVTIDPSHVEQILVNLAANARDAMPQGGSLRIDIKNVTLDAEWIEANPGPAPGDYVLLAVSDSGCGMTREVRHHVFEPFFTTKDADKGTGLGMAMVYGIVEQNGGHISVYSTEEIGTTVKVYLTRSDRLPVARSQPRPAAYRQEEGVVLLVEDEDQVRKVAKRILTSVGYVVLEAASGPEALSVFERYTGIATDPESAGRSVSDAVTNRIDILVTDVVMPRMRGTELAGILLELAPDLKVLYVSGYMGDLAREKDLREPEGRFLHKRFTSDELVGVVRGLLEG